MIPETPNRVLVVDDHIPAAEMLGRLFESHGYSVNIAHNGQDSLDIALETLPELILLDVMMPGMDGYEVLRLLRLNPLTSGIPVIFITAKDDVEDIEHGLQLGADDYIPKPVKPRELLARAKSKIESHRLRQALQQQTTDLEALLRLSEELNNHIEINKLIDFLLFLILDLVPSNASAIIKMNDSKLVTDPVRTRYKGDIIPLEFDPQKVLDELAINQYKTVCWELTAEQHLMAVPLIYDAQLHGVLLVASETPFSDRYIRLFEAIGRQSTLAVRNAELYALKVHYAENLESMVEARTSELRSAQELLIRAEKLASVGRLAAGIAHEINNPLMPIRVNLELMQEDVHNGNDVSLQDIEESLRSVNRISRIVEKLQQFTRRRGGEQPDLEPLDLNQVIQDVISLSRSFMKQSGVQIETHLGSKGSISGNRDQLEQVFLNLLINAKAAMADGGVIHVTTRNKAKSIVVTVEDTGHGIPDDMIRKIFDPFFSTKEDGSGLGLFISHEIVESHNGAIDVKSDVGRGTVFTVSLPKLPD